MATIAQYTPYTTGTHIPPVAIDLEDFDHIAGTDPQQLHTAEKPAFSVNKSNYNKFIRPDWFNRLNPVELDLESLAKGAVSAGSLFSKGADIMKNNPKEYSEYTQKLNKLFTDVLEHNNLSSFKDYSTTAIQNSHTNETLKAQFKVGIHADQRMLELMDILQIAPL